MSYGATECRDKFPAVDNLSSEISKKVFKTVDLLSAFVRSGGSEIDPTNRLSAVFGLKEELLRGRVMGLAKTDCLAPHDKVGG